ncbi:MAG: TolB family protein [Microcystaceae cyanobacterium]
MKYRIWLCILGLTGGLIGCTSYPRIVNFPFDSSGRGLNSRNTEITPQTNGQYIVFVSDRNGSQDIYLFDTQRRQLVELPGLNSLDEIVSHPSITADGQKIVFAASRLGKSAIYLYDRQTQQKRNLTQDLAAEVRNPTISADGSRIAFEAATEGQWDIIIYDPTGQPI